ncbi:BTAD domain-containing putative transcriptional regulator [Kibdelosporangium aridum]|uniref:AfsR/SARP family transcriptional regulator n=1 Tax=Kibdelosporangium aridum TaxID=2030 RepID=UPI000689C548|nr:BTAD domain-containing putative transcriptional regulator [Kibdelosporangium aridum]
MTLLAALILQANRTVSYERLTTAVWGDNPPNSATAALHTYVFRLRKAFGDVDPTGLDRIVTYKTGYLLHIQPGELDLEVFRAHVERGRAASAAGRFEQAATELDAALELWRGTVLSGVSGELVAQQSASLDEAYISAVEQRVEVKLNLGVTAELIPELNALIASYPLRERLREQAMLVLYRSGRQAEALAMYQDVYRVLSDELGIQPGPALQELHRRILSGDPTLRSPSEQKPEAPAAARPVPRQLPTDVANFTGREEYMRQLDALLPSADRSGGAVVISAIEGIAGVGKTALALHWAHHAAPRLPDGQLYVNLRGYAQSPPMEPGEALSRFLRALGVPQEQIPVDQDEQAAMYRSLMADKRMLVLLDNAMSPDQVRPLLPGSANCLVLITSRVDLRGLAALDGARRLVLDVLTADEAVNLLATTIGDERSTTEAGHVAQLAKLCGYLPLALRIAAAHLAGHVSQTVGGYLAQLAEGDRLSQLGIEHDQQAAVRASFDLSYQTLSTEAARLFRLLGLVPGPDFAPAAAAALAAMPEERTTRLLDGLASAHLIERLTPGRFQFHDLIRLYAAERAKDIDGAQEIDDALRRLFTWYLHSTGSATHALYPEIESLLDSVDVDIHPMGFTDIVEAISWLETERPSLLASVRHATQHGPRPISWRLAHVLRGYFYTRMVVPDWMETAVLGLRAADLDNDLAGQAAMLHSQAHAHFCLSSYEQALEYEAQALPLARDLDEPRLEAEIVKWSGLACVFLGRLDKAVEDLTQALDLYRRTENRHGQANTHIGLGFALVDKGQFEEAMPHYGKALELNREINSRYGEALVLHVTGVVYGHMGRFDEALRMHAQAMTLYRQVGTRYHETSASFSLAVLHCDMGSYDKALAEAERARVMSRETGDRRTECNALNTLGVACKLVGRFDDAAGYHESALQLSKAISLRKAEIEALIGLCGARRGLGNHNDAILAGQAALRGSRHSGMRPHEAHALVGLSEVLTEVGQADHAKTQARHALDIYREINYPLGEGRALRALGLAMSETDGPRSAVAYWEEALAICTRLGTPEVEQLQTLIKVPH